MGSLILVISCRLSKRMKRDLGTRLRRNWRVAVKKAKHWRKKLTYSRMRTQQSRQRMKDSRIRSPVHWRNHTHIYSQKRANLEKPTAIDSLLIYAMLNIYLFRVFTFTYVLS